MTCLKDMNPKEGQLLFYINRQKQIDCLNYMYGVSDRNYYLTQEEAEEKLKQLKQKGDM